MCSGRFVVWKVYGFDIKFKMHETQAGREMESFEVESRAMIVIFQEHCNKINDSC